jgi:hypothetical protein
MHDAAVVRGRQPGDELKRDIGRSSQRQRSAFEDRAQRLAIEQLGHQIRAVAGADVEDGDDVRVGERGNGASLLLEAMEPRRIARHGLWQDFDGDVTREPRVAGLVHLAHPARAEQCDDFVRAEVRARSKGQFVGLYGSDSSADRISPD